MEFDDERFLTLVFQYPCIYDNHDPNYKNADSREICWADIGNEIRCSGEWNHLTFVVKMCIWIYFYRMVELVCLTVRLLYLSYRYRIS
jgi:hypothetical protein